MAQALPWTSSPFGARAVYELLANSSNTAAGNWILISVSGVRPSFEAYQTTSQSLAASVMTEISSFKEKIDTINSFNISTGVFRCAASGLYLINSTVVFERATADYKIMAMCGCIKTDFNTGKYLAAVELAHLTPTLVVPY